MILHAFESKCNIEKFFAFTHQLPQLDGRFIWKDCIRPAKASATIYAVTMQMERFGTQWPSFMLDLRITEMH